MSFITKSAKRLVIAVIVLLVVVIIAGRSVVNYVAAKAVGVGGTAALGVDTKVESVSVGWLTSSVAIRGLQIANPSGYKTDRLLNLGKGSVACDVSSLLGDEVVVQEILIDSPELTVEFRAGLPPKSNLNDLLKGLESEEKQPAEPEESGPQKAFKIDLIRVTGAKVRFHLYGGDTADITLPDIELKDIANSDGTPVLLADVFKQVLAAMSRSAVTNAKGIIPDDLVKGLGDTLGTARDLLGKGSESVRKGLGEIGEKGSAIKDKAGGLLKGILGQDKKKDE